MQETPLAGVHQQLGAKMAEFAGWQMPIQYPTGILTEHKHTREAVGLFDICHMGEFRVRGAAAAVALDRLLARPVVDQKVGSCRYNFLLTEQGTVQDDLVVYRLGEAEFYVVVNAGTREGDAAWFRAQLGAGVEFIDESDATAKFDVQGPQTFAVLEALGLPAAELPPYYAWIKREFLGIPMLISRTGYTGERGVELYFPATEAVTVWNKLLSHPLVKPVGLGARDTLRLEVGYPLYGHEMDLETTPIEAGFGALVKTANREFVGRTALVQQPARKTLTAFALEGRRAARGGMEIRATDGAVLGKVTSGAFSPSLGYAVALGFVATPLAEGQAVLLGEGTVSMPARVTTTPFYKQGTARAK